MKKITEAYKFVGVHVYIRSSAGQSSHHQKNFVLHVNNASLVANAKMIRKKQKLLLQVTCPSRTLAISRTLSLTLLKNVYVRSTFHCLQFCQSGCSMSPLKFTLDYCVVVLITHSMAKICQFSSFCSIYDFSLFVESEQCLLESVLAEPPISLKQYIENIAMKQSNGHCNFQMLVVQGFSHFLKCRFCLLSPIMHLLSAVIIVIQTAAKVFVRANF